MPSEIDFGFSSTELLKWKEEKPLLPSLLLPSFFLKKWYLNLVQVKLTPGGVDRENWNKKLIFFFFSEPCVKFFPNDRISPDVKC